MNRTETNILTGEQSVIEFSYYTDGTSTIMIDEGSTPPDGYTIVTDEQVAEKTLEDYKKAVVYDVLLAVQKHLDIYAQSWGYDDIKSAVTYADEPSVEQFQLEGQALRSWRSLVWKVASDTLTSVQNNEITLPTLDEFILLLPTKPERP